MRSGELRFDEERAYSGPERRRRENPHEVEPVVLTRKYAEMIDGVNLAGRYVGDRLPLSPHDARMLLAEGWAQPAPSEQRRRDHGDSEGRREQTVYSSPSKPRTRRRIHPEAARPAEPSFRRSHRSSRARR